jgi:type III secretion protein J
MKQNTRIAVLASCALALLALAGCDQAVYTHLTEPEANEVLLTLIKGGIRAEKYAVDEKDDKSFSVMVPESQMANAIELLKADAQPSEHYGNLGEIFATKGLIASPAEERVRFMYGLQQELAKTLSQIDGVLVARVHIVMPANDPYATNLKPASASIFLKYRQDRNIPLLVPEVKELVVRSVEGLTADNIAVSLFPARVSLALPAQVPAMTHFFGASVESSSASKLWIVFALPWLLVAALLVMLVHATRVRELLVRFLGSRSGRRNAQGIDPAGSEISTARRRVG